MKKNKGFTLIELLVCIFLLAVLVGVIWFFSWGIPTVGAYAFRSDYEMQAMSIADRLGPEGREGYKDGKWDEDDEAAMMREMGLLENMKLRDVPATRLREFVRSH